MLGSIAELESAGHRLPWAMLNSIATTRWGSAYSWICTALWEKGGSGKDSATCIVASGVEDDADDYERYTPMGIEHMKEAFRSNDGTANTVIGRWYDGTEPYDLSHLDNGPVDANLPGIDGRIDEAYITVSQDGPAVSAISAQDATGWVYLTLKYSYSVSGQSSGSAP